MRRLLPCWVVVCLALAVTVAPASAQVATSDPATHGIPVRHMTLRNFVPYRVTTTVQGPPAQPVADHARDHEHASNDPFPNHGHHDHGGHRSYGGWSTPGYFLGGGYPIIWGVPYLPGFSPVYPAAVGWLPNREPAPVQQALQPPGPTAVNAPARGAPKNTSPELKARAGKFIGFGDANFADQKYLAAIERYKSASRIAPDLAEPYLRQGHALVALGQYENAVKAFRRGLRIRAQWSGSPIRLDQLYGPDRIAKVSHIETLAKAVEANPLDANLLVAMGMQLFFDGQAERAGVFFARVAQLGGNDDGLLNDFLPKPAHAGVPRQEPPAAAQGPAKIVF
jgi:hypothetical protein